MIDREGVTFYLLRLYGEIDLSVVGFNFVTPIQNKKYVDPYLELSYFRERERGGVFLFRVFSVRGVQRHCVGTGKLPFNFRP